MLGSEFWDSEGLCRDECTDCILHILKSESERLIPLPEGIQIEGVMQKPVFTCEEYHAGSSYEKPFSM